MRGVLEHLGDGCMEVGVEAPNLDLSERFVATNVDLARLVLDDVLPLEGLVPNLDVVQGV